MRPSTRVFVLTLALIAILACGAAYLLWALDEPEAKHRVLVVFGGAIGAVGGAFLFMAALLRFQGR